MKENLRGMVQPRLRKIENQEEEGELIHFSARNIR
ncbi:hypothetical protein C8N30_2951 [Sulfitobacter guttiformis]|uniref:Uncharacterized protein n=1 Tax=Sulfitobacter guttiformis TaxID=74349 RepID=A0A420DI04_9RHOB|nr:hypothetical protein C8N30_2951 [Sulfitobacter guttiformis]